MRTHTTPRGPAYRCEDGYWLIEVNLREVRQLFNHLDPAPFREKDLDPAAEAYIVDAFREIGFDRLKCLVVHLPEREATSPDALALPLAVSNYFAYRGIQVSVERRRLLQRGLGNLAAGLAFLFVCLSLRAPVAMFVHSEVLTEGLLIIGWVALWRPVEIFLYDGWTLLRQQRRLEQLASMKVEVRPREPVAGS